jgi:hypothetical protein
MRERPCLACNTSSRNRTFPAKSPSKD